MWAHVQPAPVYPMFSLLDNYDLENVGRIHWGRTDPLRATGTISYDYIANYYNEKR